MKFVIAAILSVALMPGGSLASNHFIRGLSDSCGDPTVYGAFQPVLRVEQTDKADLTDGVYDSVFSNADPFPLYRSGQDISKTAFCEARLVNICDGGCGASQTLVQVQVRCAEQYPFADEDNRNYFVKVEGVNGNAVDGGDSGMFEYINQGGNDGFEAEFCMAANMAKKIQVHANVDDNVSNTASTGKGLLEVTIYPQCVDSCSGPSDCSPSLPDTCVPTGCVETKCVEGRCVQDAVPCGCTDASDCVGDPICFTWGCQDNKCVRTGEVSNCCVFDDDCAIGETCGSDNRCGGGPGTGGSCDPENCEGDPGVCNKWGCVEDACAPVADSSLNGGSCGTAPAPGTCEAQSKCLDGVCEAQPPFSNGESCFGSGSPGPCQKFGCGAGGACMPMVDDSKEGTRCGDGDPGSCVEELVCVLGECSGENYFTPADDQSCIPNVSGDQDVACVAGGTCGNDGNCVPGFSMGNMCESNVPTNFDSCYVDNICGDGGICGPSYKENGDDCTDPDYPSGTTDDDKVCFDAVCRGGDTKTCQAEVKNPQPGCTLTNPNGGLCYKDTAQCSSTGECVQDLQPVKTDCTEEITVPSGGDEQCYSGECDGSGNCVLVEFEDKGCTLADTPANQCYASGKCAKTGDILTCVPDEPKPFGDMCSLESKPTDNTCYAEKDVCDGSGKCAPTFQDADSSCDDPPNPNQECYAAKGKCAGAGDLITSVRTCEPDPLEDKVFPIDFDTDKEGCRSADKCLPNDNGIFERTLQVKPKGDVCRPVANICDKGVEVCDGKSPICPDDDLYDIGYTMKCATTQFLCGITNDAYFQQSNGIYQVGSGEDTCTIGQGRNELPMDMCDPESIGPGGKCPSDPFRRNRRFGLSNFSVLKCIPEGEGEWICCGKCEEVNGIWLCPDQSDHPSCPSLPHGESRFLLRGH